MFTSPVLQLIACALDVSYAYTVSTSFNKINGPV